MVNSRCAAASRKVRNSSARSTKRVGSMPGSAPNSASFLPFQLFSTMPFISVLTSRIASPTPIASNAWNPFGARPMPPPIPSAGRS